MTAASAFRCSPSLTVWPSWRSICARSWTEDPAPTISERCGLGAARRLCYGRPMFPERLIAGHRAFLAGRFAAERSRYKTLAETGQRPETMVVGCIDSRASPEVIFDAAPGELLVARNVANIVPPYEPDRATQHGTSAALEFAVQALRVKHVVVLGHAF